MHSGLAEPALLVISKTASCVEITHPQPGIISHFEYRGLTTFLVGAFLSLKRFLSIIQRLIIPVWHMRVVFGSLLKVLRGHP